MNYEEAIRLLSLNDDYTLEQLKKSYRDLLKKYHPDLHTKDSAQEQLFVEKKTKQINEAYEVLSKRLKNGTNKRSESTLERKKREVINKLKEQLNKLENFFDFDAFFYKNREVDLIEETIEKIKFCASEIEILNVIRELKISIRENNFDMFERFINNWQVNSIVNDMLKQLYSKYQKELEHTNSVIDVSILITKLKEECYLKANEYENRVHNQISKKLDEYVARYSNNEFYYIVSNKINKIKKNLEDKIANIYLDESYSGSKEYFNSIISKIYNQFERDILNLLKTTATRSKKISKLYDYFLDDNQFQNYLNEKINYLYSNITCENFDKVYSEIVSEINSLYRNLKIKNLNLNYIKNKLLRNYVISIEHLDMLKDSDVINETTDLYQRTIEFLTSLSNSDISLEFVCQLENINFIDLEYSKKLLDKIIFYSMQQDCGIYIKKKKSKVNGNVIKVKNIDEYVDYDYNIDKLNCNFSSSISLSEFRENYISLQQFLKQARFVGRFAKVNQLIGNVKGIVLYEINNNALFFDVEQNKFMFIIIKDNISYFKEAEVVEELKDKVKVYKMLIEQYSLIFDIEDSMQYKTKRFSN